VRFALTFGCMLVGGCDRVVGMDGYQFDRLRVECASSLPSETVSVPEQHYSIDATEVTRCQYGLWLATDPPTSGQPGACSWNSSFEPACQWPPEGKGNHPVVCVDWCDAYAYCQAMGKRLCGAVGGGAFQASNDDSTSEWYMACSCLGERDYVTGDEGEAAEFLCNGKQGLGTTGPVGSFPACGTCGLLPGVFDLSGNVGEWVNFCEGAGDADDRCAARGGSYRNSRQFLRCDYPATLDFTGGWARGDRHETLGFRCCASL